MDAELQFIVDEEWHGQRADRFLQYCCCEHSRSVIQNWFANDLVQIDAKVCKKSALLKMDQKIQVKEIPESRPSSLEPENIPLDIRYEDQDLLVIYKPKGLVVHPGNGIWKGTLAAGLLYHYKYLSERGGPLRPGIVHRLDKDTSGLMVVARNDRSHLALSHQLQDRSLSRIYTALVWKHPEPEGTIDLPLDRDLRNRLKRAVRPDGKAARTHYRVREFLKGLALLDVQLESGRTHQIRVHMSHIGHPIFGDPLYGGREEFLSRLGLMDRTPYSIALKTTLSQCLEATEIHFKHPSDQREMQFSTHANEEIQRLVRQFSLQEM